MQKYFTSFYHKLIHFGKNIVLLNCISESLMHFPYRTIGQKKNFQKQAAF